MPDKGQRATDAEFRRLRAKVNDIYRQAYKEIEQKGKEFAQAFARREAQMRQQVADGKMTQADFDAWLRGQVFQGKQWAAKKKQIEDTLYHADQVAQSLVNDARFNVFAANANYVTQDIGKATRVDTSFNLYDANAVKRLAVKQPDLLPPKKKVGKDKSYKWYNRQVNTAITQGIIQGASIGEIARRIGKQTGESNCTAMLRNARTMFTGAQNAGRIDGLHQAQELGIRVQKQWMATPDNRTRDTHAELDGQIVDVDEPFITSAGNEIMYPGDPAAAPEEVWNCRCTLVYVYPDYPSEMQKDDEMERFGSALQGAQNAAEFWMNMDADQMDAFNASGENIYDFYNRLHDKASPETLEMPEWKPDAPGGASNYQLPHDYSASRIDVSQIPARSEGWMAGAETTGIINVREGGFDDWQYVIGHEAGHQLANYNPELQRTIVDNPGGLLGRYNQKRGFFDGAFGEYNAEEAWADAVSSYVNSPRRFQEQYPELYDAVDGFFKSSPSARDFIDRTYAAYRRAVGL